MQSMQIREGGGAYLGGPSLSGACQQSSCCLWWCHTSPAFSSPPRNTGRKNFSRCFKQTKAFPTAVRHGRTHLVGFDALHGQMVAVHPQSVPEDAQTVLFLLLKHLTDIQGYTCCLSFVVTCVICVETADEWVTPLQEVLECQHSVDSSRHPVYLARADVRWLPFLTNGIQLLDVGYILLL